MKGVGEGGRSAPGSCRSAAAALLSPGDPRGGTKPFTGTPGWERAELPSLAPQPWVSHPA